MADVATSLLLNTFLILIQHAIIDLRMLLPPFSITSSHSVILSRPPLLLSSLFLFSCTRHPHGLVRPCSCASPCPLQSTSQCRLPVFVSSTINLLIKTYPLSYSSSILLTLHHIPILIALMGLASPSLLSLKLLSDKSTSHCLSNKGNLVCSLSILQSP